MMAIEGVSAIATENDGGLSATGAVTGNPMDGTQRLVGFLIVLCSAGFTLWLLATAWGYIAA